MNTHEQRIREFAYQIWESEGRPEGHTERHWHMASKLAETHAASAQEYAGSTEPAPSIEPIVPISPSQPAQPVPPSDPIQPTDPVQPNQPNASALQVNQADAEPAKPVKAKRLRTKAADKASADAAPAESASAPIIAEQAKKPGRLKKSKNQENEPA